MHYLHCKLHFFLILVFFGLTSSDYSFDFTEAALTNIVHYLELVDKLLICLDSDCNFISEIHAVARFKELVVG